MRLKPNNSGYFFHPYELVFSGYSGSGKTSLITSLSKRLSPYYDIGFYKRDAHSFEMDSELKDTWMLRNVGKASGVFINDQTKHAYIKEGKIDQVQASALFLDHDILFIEGHKHSKIPKILVLNENTKAQTKQDVAQGKITEILAVVGEGDADPFEGRYPFFQRDNLTAIEKFALELLSSKAPANLYGLVLTGGKSQRMLQDKGGLHYHAQNQIEHTRKLLAPFCDEVFVSCRNDQSGLPFLNGHPLIYDTYPSFGPSSGILSAQFEKPNAAWLVLGCDLPYLDRGTIENLVANRNHFKLATCFLNPKRGWPEPLCAIYEPKSHMRLTQYFSQGKPCPRKVLFNSNVNSLKLSNKNALNNVNTPEQRAQAMEALQQKKESRYAD